MAVNVGELLYTAGILGSSESAFSDCASAPSSSANVTQETAKGNTRPGVVGMTLDEVFVRLSNRVEPVLDAPA